MPQSKDAHREYMMRLRGGDRRTKFLAQTDWSQNKKKNILTGKEYEIITRYYSLDNYEAQPLPSNLKEVAQVVGLSRAQCHNIKKVALAKLTPYSD